MKKEEEKLTLYEYQKKYTRVQNTKNIKFIYKAVILLIALIIIYCLFDFSMSMFKLNKYAGYASVVVSALLFIVFFIIPVSKINKFNSFKVNVNGKSARIAKKENEALRNEIAKNFISYEDEVIESGWYNNELIDDLRKGLAQKDRELIKTTLSKLYSGDIRKTAKKSIYQYAGKAGLLTAVSQSSTLDATLLITTELSLIKEIVFLYGFRPSDARMLKIYSGVINSALISYGASSTITGSASKFSEALTEGIPVLGKLISTTIESASQGLINAVVTIIIGYQTINYLDKEYHLQDMLDGIDLGCEEDLKEQTELIKKELNKKTK